jgi:flagellar protein FliO/FliZ
MQHIVAAGLCWLIFLPFPASAATGAQPPAWNPVWVSIKIFASLVVLVVLGVAVIRFLASRGWSAPTGPIEVLAARQLAPGRSLQIVQVFGRRYLIGVAEHITMLADVTDHSSSAALQDGANNENVSEPGTGFDAVLQDALRQVRLTYRPQVYAQHAPEPREDETT